MATPIAVCIIISMQPHVHTGIRSIAEQEEPLGRLLSRMELADGLVLDKVSSPIGVLLIIFEARPDALPQIAALAIRSGNGLLLKVRVEHCCLSTGTSCTGGCYTRCCHDTRLHHTKMYPPPKASSLCFQVYPNICTHVFTPQGGKEASRSNAILHAIITDALAEVAPMVGRDLVSLVTSREGVDQLLALHDVIDLVIPRGSNALVSHIQNNTKIPVLGHADGICHIYVDEACDIEQAVRICVDAKVCTMERASFAVSFCVLVDITTCVAAIDTVLPTHCPPHTLSSPHSARPQLPAGRLPSRLQRRGEDPCAWRPGPGRPPLQAAGRPARCWCVVRGCALVVECNLVSTGW